MLNAKLNEDTVSRVKNKDPVQITKREKVRKRTTERERMKDSEFGKKK